MKKISSLCYCLLLASAIFSQNLVVNPSFEITNTNCANFGGEGFRQDLSPSWDNANSNAQGDSCSSPDLFSSCNIAFTNMPGGGMGALGFQYSRTGTRHAGFITYDALGSTYREYIQGRTSAPLVAGQKYCVSMYVSLADLVPYATNNIGVYFSNTQYMRDACTQGALINVTPQLNYGCGAITDTSENWVRLQWDYTATGGEQYFIIGNFFNNAGTVIQNTGVSPFPHTFAYYFIDDVSIVPNTCCFADVPSTASFCIFDAASNLTATTGTGTVCNANISGTWSGPGITNPSTGTFDPSVAGIGTHLVTFTLSCGFVDTVLVSVNSCTAVSVCKETNGNLTVSGGNPVYTWSYWQAATSTPITTQAQCVACGGSWLPFGGTCLAGVTPLTSCNTPAQWVQFATGVSVAPPAGKDTIRVVDNAGTTVVMNGLSTVQPCTQCATITVSVQSKQDVTCATPNSGSATFSATGTTGTVTYTWSPSTGSTSATASGLAAGTYNVTVTDGNSCTGIGSVTIAAPAAPSLVLSNPVNPGCGQNNGSVSATLSGGTAPYQVTIDNGLGSPQVQNVPIAGTAPVSNLPAGNYTITVRDANQCTASTTLVLTAPNAPTINPVTVTDEVCAGQNNGSITASATGGTGTLQWSYALAATPSNTTAIAAFPVNNMAPGNYILLVSDANGCTAAQTFSIAAGANCCNISLSVATIQPSCGQADGGITITPSPAGNYTYAWSNSLPAQAVQSNLPAGQYAVTVSETANPSCQKDTVINLNPSNGPTITFSNQVNPGCGQSNGSVSVTLAGGSAPYQVTIDDGQGNQQSQTVPIAGTAPVANMAAATYTITVVDANSCSAIQTITFAAPAPPTVAVATTPESCAQNDGSITLTITGGTGTISVSWSNGSIGNSLTQVAAGNYSYTVTDQNNCQATGTATVAAPICCTLDASATAVATTCGNSNGSIVAAIATAGVAPYRYSLDGSNYQQSDTFTNLSGGSYTLFVLDSNNCGDTLTVTVGTSYNSLAVTFNTVEPGCAGTNNGSVAAVVTGGAPTYSYVWNNGDTAASIGNLSAGAYAVTVTDGNGCTLAGNTVLQGAQPFSITLGNDTSFCFGNSATLTAPAGYTQYLWSNGDTSQGIVVDSSSTYSVTVTNAAGCTASDAVNITVFANPVIQLPTDTSMFENNPIKLVPVISSGATGTFVWTPNEAISCADCAQPEVNPTDSITYTLNYTDVHNCTASATIHVRVMNDAEISMPTAFSPNGDGVNDILRPLGFNVKSIRWKVFNRWGELVFQTNEWNTGWDGTFKTVEQPLGVYVYTIEATFMNKKVKHYNGNVTLVR